MRLIEDWRSSHKFLSTWIAAFWTGILGYVAANPGFALTVWGSIPEALRPDVPAWGKWILLWVVAFATWYAARITRQGAK